MRAATRFAAMGASNVVGDAGDAAPSRAGPRLNVGSNYVRPATGQRRITARVMRPFTPSHGPRRRGPRLGVHTLPLQAHPRAGTETFCSLGAALGESGVVGCANGAAKRYAALRRGKPHTRFPLWPRFKLPVSVPVYARPGHPQFQARPFTSFPYSRHESCGDNFRAGPPDALRAFTVTASLWQPARQETCHAGCEVASPPGTTELRTLCFRGPKEAGASKTKFCCSWTWRREIGRPGCATTRDLDAALVLTWRKSADFQSLETGHGSASNVWTCCVLSVALPRPGK